MPIKAVCQVAICLKQDARMYQHSSMAGILLAHAAMPATCCFVHGKYKYPCQAPISGILDHLNVYAMSSRLLHELPDIHSDLLPADIRCQIEPCMNPKVLAQLKEVAAAITAAAQARAVALQVLLRQFAWHHYVSCAQVMEMLDALGARGVDRCSAVVILWTKVVDRGNLVQVGVGTPPEHVW